MSKKTASLFTSILGYTAFLTGCFVIAGWYLESNALIQIHKSFAPMQYNTALGFIFCGLGLMSLRLENKIATIIFGALAVILSGATLYQYISGYDFGIDEFFIEAGITTKTSHPGRMAPNTALCFTLVGMALILHKNKTMTISLACSVLVLALLSLAGYLTEAEGLYGWGNLTRMAIHTAIGFILLGTGTLLYGCKPGDERFDIWKVAPFAVGVVGLVITFFAWHATKEFTDARNQQYFQTLVSDTENALDTRFQLYEQTLWGGVGLFNSSEFVSRAEWKNYVNALGVEEKLSGILGVGYIDYIRAHDLPEYLATVRQDNAPEFTNHPDTPYLDKFIIRYSSPVEKNRQALGLDIGFEDNRRTAAEKSRDTGKPALTKKIKLVQDMKEQAGFLLLVPVYEKGAPLEDISQRRQTLIGWVYAPFIGHDFLHDLTNISSNQLSFAVYDGIKPTQEALIYRSKPYQNASFSLQTQKRIAEQIWTLEWQATPLFNPPANKNMPRYILALGLFGTALIFTVLNQLLRQKETISRQVEKRTVELDAARKEAERANAMKSEFLANMSHELRTPLNGVIGTADLLVKTKLSESQMEYANIISRSGESLLLLINDILDLSKIEAGEFELNPEKFVLRHMLKDAIQPLVTRASESNVSLDVDYEMTVPYGIVADPLRIRQILVNLIGNAIKFVESGSVIVRVRQKGHKDSQTILRIEVEDNGIGIPEDRLDDIFGKFAQADATTTKKYGGTGLGLAISKNLVEMMGGHIGVESTVGQGSTFWFEVPVEIAQQEPPENKTVNMKAIKDKKVLVIEPSSVTRKIIATYLKDFGVPHKAVASIKQGLKELSKDAAYDICFIQRSDDEKLGDFVQQVQSETSLKDLHLVLITKVDAIDDIESIRSLGFSTFILKPVYSDDVLDALLKASGQKSFRKKEKRAQLATKKDAKILLAEDDIINQKVATKMLEDLGYEIDVAASGVEAVEMAETNQYDVVLMDIMMPEMDGYAATRAIREKQESGEIGQFPIIALTANAMKEQTDKCLEAGMVDFLTKPVRQENLKNKLDEWLGKNQTA